MTSSPDEPERLQAELSLLAAMYPSQTTFDPTSRELRLNTTTENTDTKSSAQLVLRLPLTYPGTGLPELISARDAARNDVREATRRAIETLALPPDEECLDRLIVAFEEVLTRRVIEGEPEGEGQGQGHSTAQHDDCGVSPSSSTSIPVHNQERDRDKTAIIWLHHLLAPSKRKLAISPPPPPASSTAPPRPRVRGLTKPGYPGVMVFSGPSALVDEHVRALKGLNWHAFQVRYDSGEEDGRDGQDGGGEVWRFAHGEGVVEVQTMAGVVGGIVDEGSRKLFLRVIGVK